MNKEIGSTFYLTRSLYNQIETKKKYRIPNILGSKTSITYLSTCRSAIFSALSILNEDRKVAILPGFTCESVLQPFLLKGYQIFPYNINLDLGIDSDSLKTLIEKKHPTVILIHRYFGFNTIKNIEDIKKISKEYGLKIIEDVTQTMFSNIKKINSNITVGSIRKWLPLPDGAFISENIPNIENDKELEVAKINALLSKGTWIESEVSTSIEKDIFRKKLAEAESLLDSRKCKVFSMSNISKGLYKATNLTNIKEKRRKNYKFLLSELSQFKNFEIILCNINDDVCPFLMPVYIKENRSELQQFLASNNIYPTVIWKCPDYFKNMVNNKVKYIYEHILCFHIDQRYNIDDMKRIVSTIKTFYS